MVVGAVEEDPDENEDVTEDAADNDDSAMVTLLVAPFI